MLTLYNKYNIYTETNITLTLYNKYNIDTV